MSGHQHLGRAGDPLDVQSGDIEAVRRLLPHLATVYARAGEVRASDDFIAGFIRGLARRPKTPRRVWAAVVLATIALVLAAFMAGRTSAAPRPGPQPATVPIPPSQQVATVTAEGRTGAPLSPSAPEASDTGLTSPEASGAPPTAVIDARGATGRNPHPPSEPATQDHSGIAGRASYYDDGPGLYVALPGWTRLSPIRYVIVCANVGLWRCATAPVWTSCGCHTNEASAKIADLSPDLFELITGWTPAERWLHGVVPITLQVIHQ